MINDKYGMINFYKLWQEVAKSNVDIVGAFQGDVGGLMMLSRVKETAARYIQNRFEEYKKSLTMLPLDDSQKKQLHQFIAQSFPKRFPGVSSDEIYENQFFKKWVEKLQNQFLPNLVQSQINLNNELNRVAQMHQQGNHNTQKQIVDVIKRLRASGREDLVKWWVVNTKKFTQR